MKSTLTLVCATLVAAAQLPAQNDSAKEPAATNAPMDKVSYFIGSQIGTNIANNFKQQGIDLDLDNFLAAIRDPMLILRVP